MLVTLLLFASVSLQGTLEMMITLFVGVFPLTLAWFPRYPLPPLFAHNNWIPIPKECGKDIIENMKNEKDIDSPKCTDQMMMRGG